MTGAEWLAWFVAQPRIWCANCRCWNEVNPTSWWRGNCRCPSPTTGADQ